MDGDRNRASDFSKWHKAEDSGAAAIATAF